MEFPKTPKRAKMNGIRKDQEKLLISYSGEEKLTDSDSDRVQPLELPPTRLRRPKSRKIRVSSNTKSMFSFWNFCQVVFVVVVIGSMVSMMWFTIILKTSLESMKKRVSICAGLMGKHRLKFKAMKFPSRQNGTLIPDQDSDSDIQEFALPKKRIVKPGKSAYVTRRRAGCCRTCASIVLSLILIASILCVVVLGWFSLRLKRDLDLLKIRLAEVETSDRSTSKECLERGKDLEKKLKVLSESSTGHLKADEKNFHVLFKRIKVLNATVKYLQTKIKSPKSVSSINHDISLLKKAMADTSREMTEVTDKVKQLRTIAHLQNNNIKHLKVQLYNVSVQIAKLSGQPTPRPQVNTATPPWLLQVPVADTSKKSKTTTLQAEVAEKLRKNITLQVRKDMNKLVGFIRRANKTVQDQIHELDIRLSGLVKNVSKHLALMDSLFKKNTEQSDDKTSSKQSEVGSIPLDVVGKYKNLTKMVVNLKSMFDKHHQQFQEITSNIASINLTVHQHVAPSTTCNCSLDGVWTAMSKDQNTLHSLKSDLELLQDSVQKLTAKDSEPAKQSVSSPEKQTLQPTKSRLTSTVTNATSAQQPTTVYKNVSGTSDTTVKTTSKSNNGTVAPTEPALNENKRMTDDEDERTETDLDIWGGGGADDVSQDPIFNDNTKK